MVPQQQRRRRRRAALARTAERRLVVARGSGGFGFTIAGQRPCVVSAVASGGPAERAGLRAGDALLTVDGANVARAPHASVARLVAAAPEAISLSVAPRESPPTDTEDTEPDERARTRRRHPPPRRRPQMMHHPGCHAAPSTSGVNEILQNLSRAQLTSNHIARLECRAVVGYLGTIETPQAAATAAPGNVRTAVRKLRQERRPAAPVLLSVLPNALFLRRPTGQVLAQYPRERIVHAGCGSEADRRFFGLVTSAESQEAEASHSCHVFAVDPRMAEHEAHLSRAREFQVACTRDPVAERCLEFPPSAEYVVGVIRGMYSLPAEESASPGLQQISKLAVKGDSPAVGNFSRCNRAAFRIPRDRRPGRPDDDGPDFVANSPQPSNHSEVTTTSSNSDSGIGFHNDCRNIADRILVVDFARGPPVNVFVREPIRRPVGLVGCGFDADGSFLSNAIPVVDGFAGQGRPLNLDDVMLNANDPQPVRRVNDDGYDYNGRGGAVYDRVYSEGEGLYDAPGAAALEMYEERWGADGASVRSARSHEEPARVKRHHLQASLDDMLVLRPRETKPENDDDNFVHPASVKCKVRKSIKPLNILSKTKNILSRRDRSCESRDRDAEENRDARRRALSASCGEVCSAAATEDGLAGAASEPDLRDTQSEQSSPFRRWTTGSGAGSSYRHHDHRNMYNKQISEGSGVGVGGGGAAGGVARWSLGLEQLLADPAGAAAFAHFLAKEFAAENIRFWWSCEQYSNTEDPAKRAALAAEIWQRHLDEKAPEPVNVDATARRAAALRLYNEPAAPDLFHQAQKQIFNVMKFDSYPRFLRSGVHAECARADLCGLPPPYAPANNAQAADTPTKLKKSASNASERRRSGGASLLPWKLRAPSKDRNAPAPAPAPAPSQPPPTDVVKSRQWAGQCSLCRVALPDGATSVVGVDENVTVRQLVDRLLQRRNLACATYDVVLKDFNEGESPNLDLNAPSTVLGGREVTVERRVVLRIEVGGRCVAVRCGRSRRLRHVLRPVLARYLGSATLLRRHHTHLHPDTSTQDLEGARLQIIEISDSEEGSGVACIIVQRPDATNDATCDLPDNDTQSISVASTSSRSRDYSLTNGLTGTIGLPATNGLSGDCCSLGDENSLGNSNSTLGNSNSTLGNSNSTLGNSNSTLGSSNNGLGNCNNGLVNSNNGLGNCNNGLVNSNNGLGSSSNGLDSSNNRLGSSNNGLGNSNNGLGNSNNASGPGGRVRAALRSGPNLHHHPPDFLENLRETQRQRLQGKPSPPPLPPKPPQRPPTVV